MLALIMMLEFGSVAMFLKMAQILSFNINNGSSEFGSKSMVRQNRNKRALKAKIKNEHTMVNEKLVEISHFLLI